MIINHDHEEYRKIRKGMGTGRWNGAFYYSKEICKNIIPNVETDRNWVTVRVPDVCMDHSIVFIHNNLYPQMYDYLKPYKDLILVCGVRETCKKVQHLGTPLYMPLSVDVEYVSQFKREKTRDVAFAGRIEKADGVPKGVHCLHGMPRQELLPKIAQYREVFAVGRTAIEAKILGCEILPYDKRFPDPSRWKILDNKEASIILQHELDRIEGHG